MTWDDVAPLRATLQASGLTAEAFTAYVERLRETNARRVREGDLDHLVFYALQSTRFTTAPVIEPALSAKALVERLDEGERAAFLRDGTIRASHIPPAVRSRVSALVGAIDGRSRDPRLAYFRGLVQAQFPDRGQREAALGREYLRVMRFVYEKEFVAQKSGRAAAAVADLYRTRGLSTDTAVEAGFLVHYGLGIFKSLQPERRIRRVLIVGPGLDLAPRIALLDDRPPESYQPWAVIDALLSVNLAGAEDLEVVAADINPRVIEHLRRSRTEPPALTLVSEIRDSDTVTLSDDYRSYFAQLGRRIGEVENGTPTGATAGHLRKRVKVAASIAQAVRPVSLDIVTERLDGDKFDLIVATNILPYFDDVQLALAMANIAAMIAPGGVFLHNEPRPVLGEIADALGLSFEQSRHVTIAKVQGASAPLFDSVFLHRKKR